MHTDQKHGDENNHASPNFFAEIRNGKGTEQNESPNKRVEKHRKRIVGPGHRGTVESAKIDAQEVCLQIGGNCTCKDQGDSACEEPASKNKQKKRQKGENGKPQKCHRSYEVIEGESAVVHIFDINFIWTKDQERIGKGKRCKSGERQTPAKGPLFTDQRFPLF